MEFVTVFEWPEQPAESQTEDEALSAGSLLCHLEAFLQAYRKGSDGLTSFNQHHGGVRYKGGVAFAEAGTQTGPSDREATANLTEAQRALLLLRGNGPQKPSDPDQYQLLQPSDIDPIAIASLGTLRRHLSDSLERERSGQTESLRLRRILMEGGRERERLERQLKGALQEICVLKSGGGGEDGTSVTIHSARDHLSSKWDLGAETPRYKIPDSVDPPEQPPEPPEEEHWRPPSAPTTAKELERAEFFSHLMAHIQKDPTRLGQVLVDLLSIPGGLEWRWGAVARQEAIRAVLQDQSLMDRLCEGVAQRCHSPTRPKGDPLFSRVMDKIGTSTPVAFSPAPPSGGPSGVRSSRSVDGALNMAASPALCRKGSLSPRVPGCQTAQSLTSLPTAPVPRLPSLPTVLGTPRKGRERRGEKEVFNF